MLVSLLQAQLVEEAVKDKFVNVTAQVPAIVIQYGLGDSVGDATVLCLNIFLQGE